MNHDTELNWSNIALDGYITLLSSFFNLGDNN